MVIKRDLEFMYEIGCLRFVERTWKQFLNPDVQNLAEHTLRVMWIAIILAKHEKVTDLGKVMKMALVHDIGESRSVDVHYMSRLFAERHEDEAVKETFGNTSVDEFEKIWEEYEKRECIESKIVKDADTLDIDLELKELETKGTDLRKNFIRHRKRVSDMLFTNSAKKFWKEIQNSNPHDWHLKGSNRYTAGDWKK